MRNVLITGATGFVGSFLCKKLLEETDDRLYLLIRKKGAITGKQRVCKELSGKCDVEQYFKDGRIVVLEGELTQEKFGLLETDYQMLLDHIQVIYHSAATIKFGLPYEEAQKINFWGTLRILQMMKGSTRTDFDRLNYISTAYIAGSITEGFLEESLTCGQEFSNTYEQTKYETEILLSLFKDQVTIYRLSIVASSGADGETHRNNIIFKFVKLFSTGKKMTFYCDDSHSINLVPVDYVINGICQLSSMPETLGKTFHLVSEKNTNVKEGIQYLCRNMGVEEPDFVGMEQFCFDPDNSLSHFFEYVRMSHSFGDEETRELLGKYGIKAAPIDKEYFEKMVDYAKSQGMIRS